METDQSLKTFVDYLYQNEQSRPDMVYLRQPIHGVWHEFTWKETMERARKITTFLKSIGLKKGDKIAILSKNCAEWLMADFAIAMGGFISVPIFATQHKAMIQFILNHAEVKAIFVGKVDNWQEMEPGIPDSLIRIAFSYENPMPAQYQWNELLAEYAPDSLSFVPDPEDIYTIMYTSGTSGNPKGVMINFGTHLSSIELYSKEKIISPDQHHDLLSYLPLAHVIERIVVEGASIKNHITVSFVESVETFSQNIKDTSPTLFVAVPRIWTQFQKGILKHIPQSRLDILLKIPLLNYFLKRKIVQELGLQRASFKISGAAPISISLLEWYHTLGIDILEGYGQTENLAYATLNMPGEQKAGSVGKPRLGVEIKIAENDEILTQSDIVMLGYYKNEEATKKAFTPDGFFHTGDRGHFDEEGYLYIHGRVSDPFKTDKGEFVNPIPIEDKFTRNHDIEQLCCIGLNLPQPVLLVVLSQSARGQKHEVVSKRLKETLDNINPGLTKYEKVSHIIVVNDHWTPENGLLTPTLKLIRHAIHDKYIDLAQKVYESTDPILWE